MSTSSNKQVVSEFLERVFNEHSTAALSDLVAEDIVEALTAGLQETLYSVDGLQCTTLLQVAEEDTVITRVLFEGTVRETFLGMPAPGRPLRAKAYFLAVLADDRIQSCKLHFDVKLVLALGLDKLLPA